jgi:uncharacterized protein (TIGR02117 family)
MKLPPALKALARYSALTMLGMAIVLAIGYFMPRQWGPAACDNQPIEIYVAGEAAHVNLIVPVTTTAYDWGEFLDLATLGRKPAAYRYLKMGWGDRAFYINTPTWSEFQLTNALRALVAPNNPAALYVQGYVDLPQAAGVEVKCVRLSAANYRQLVAFLQASFQLTADQPHSPQPIQAGYEPTSSFYEATGHYSILRTCNSWAAEGLESANVNTPLWSGLASAVMRQIPSGCNCKG